MKILRTVFSLAPILFLSATVSMAQGDRVVVKRAWTPGSYVMTQTSRSQGEQTVGKETAKTGSTETMVWELQVGEPNVQGEKKIVAKIVKCQFTEEGDSPSSYDSEAPAAGQDKDNAFVYGPLIGMPVEITLDSDDAVVEVSGLDKLWTNLSAKASTDAQKGRLAEVGIALADKTVEQSLRRIESVVPKKAVAVGEKWTAGVRSELPLIGEVKQRYDCSLKGVEATPSEKLAVVQMEVRYEATKPKPGKIQGQEITVSKLDVIEKGDIKFNLDTGIAAVDEKTLNVSAVLDATDERGRPLRVIVKSNNDVRTTIVPSGQIKPEKTGKADSAPDASGAQKSPGQDSPGVQKMLRGIPPKSAPPDNTPP